jgi:hypothetical protein
MAFTATQTISDRACEFDWRAKAGPFGMISARDALEHGEGHLDVTALGIISIARAEHTPALVRGELMCYLAELAWAPSAIFLKTTLRWRDVGPDALAVSAGAGETILSLDSDGRIAGAYAPNRPRSASPPFMPTPWRGRFSDYRLHEYLWLPFVGEVAWEIDDKDIVYWQGQIQAWEAFVAGTNTGDGPS